MAVAESAHNTSNLTITSTIIDILNSRIRMFLRRNDANVHHYGPVYSKVKNLEAHSQNHFPRAHHIYAPRSLAQDIVKNARTVHRFACKNRREGNSM
jgi:hypothetical protein